MKAICIIPARMASSRFPGKPLAKALGLPMILHIYWRCRLFEGYDRTIVATCDEEIAEIVREVGGEVAMTSNKLERATDRVEEAVGKLDIELKDDDFVQMIQGDEISLTPDMLSQLHTAYTTFTAPVTNLVSPLAGKEEQDDVNVVKVVTDTSDRVLYMSRSPIPSQARVESPVLAYQQTGAIGFSAGFLREFGRMPQTPLEKIESIDMLRVLENGLDIRVIRTESETIGVDTPAELVRAEAMLAEDPITSRYLS